MSEDAKFDRDSWLRLQSVFYGVECYKTNAEYEVMEYVEEIYEFLSTSYTDDKDPEEADGGPKDTQIIAFARKSA